MWRLSVYATAFFSQSPVHDPSAFFCDYQQPMTTEGETPSEHWIFIIITIIIIIIIIIIIMNDGDNGTRNNHGEHDVRIVCSGHNKKCNVLQSNESSYS
jgi:hypothetical protein